MRVLAFAFRPLEEEIENALEEDLIFCGLAGMSDCPRQEAMLAVARCRDAGIRPVMITGDHPRTAFAVVRNSASAAATMMSSPARIWME